MKKIFASLLFVFAALLPLGVDASKTDTFENDLLLLVFNNTNIANIGDATGIRGSSTAGTFWIAFYTADPGETGTATTNEATYTGYVRVAVNRASGAGGFTVTGNSVSPTSNVDGGECTASCTGSLTNWGIVNTSSGAGKLLYKGALSPAIALAVGVIPRLKSTSTVTED